MARNSNVNVKFLTTSNALRDIKFQIIFLETWNEMRNITFMITFKGLQIQSEN